MENQPVGNRHIGTSRAAQRRRQLAEDAAYLLYNPGDPLFRQRNQNYQVEGQEENIQHHEAQNVGSGTDEEEGQGDRSNDENISDPEDSNNDSVSSGDSDDDGEDNASAGSENESTDQSGDDDDLEPMENHEEEYTTEDEEVAYENDSTDEEPFMRSTLPRLNRPLQLQPDITAKDYLLSELAIAVRHHHTYESILSQLKWIKRTSIDSYLPNSKTALWKALERDKSTASRHLYCRECRDKIGEGDTITNECSCNKCGPDKDRKYAAYFLIFDLLKQIKELLRIPNIGHALESKIRW